MNWIASGERRPEEGVEVLTVCITSSRRAFPLMLLAEWNGDYWAETTEWRPIEVTHWMPLPAPPQ